MTNEYFYSPSTGGFYSYASRKEFEESSAGWPADALSLTDEEYVSLLSGQESGKIIVPGEGGVPVLSDPEINWLNVASARKTELLTLAAKTTSDWKTELQLNTISDEDKEKLKSWMSYIKELKSIDVSLINDKKSFINLQWPDAPAV